MEKTKASNKAADSLPRIGILGLGHVGLTLGLAFADAGFTVHGYDIKESVRNAIKSKKSHFKERELPELLEKHVGKNFIVLEEFNKDELPEAYFITVGTPIQRDNTPDWSYVKQAAENLGDVLRKGDIIILRSTVPLGTSRNVVLPILEKKSGLVGGQDFSLVFAPERTVEGNAFEELRTLPQIVGGLDADGARRTVEIFKKLTNSVVELDSLEEAEMIKLINNTFRETTFAFANEISLIARKWGLNTSKLIAAANEGYTRSRVPRPSPGVGGYCLTKDSYILMHSAREKGHEPRLLMEVRELTATMLHDLAAEIRDFAKQHFRWGSVRVGILGFAFKGVPATSDVRGSATFSLIKRLNKLSNIELVGFDPHVSPETIREMGAEPVASAEQLVKDSDVIVIMNNNPAFGEISRQAFERADRPKLLCDTWGLYSKEDFEEHAHVTYSTL